MTEIMLRNVPSDWKLVKLGQLFVERREKVSDKDYPALSVTRNGVVPQMEGVAKTDDGDNRKKVCAGDFVINSRSDRRGSSGLSTLDGSVSLINIVLEPRQGHPRFLHHLLKSYAFQEDFYRYGHGIVADLWTTRFSDMRSIVVALPDLPTQRAIADFLDRETARIDGLIEKKERLVATLEAKRRVTAIQCLSTGMSRLVWDTDNYAMRLVLGSPGWVQRSVKSVVTFMTSGSRGWSDLLGEEGEGFLQSGNIGRQMEVNLDFSQRVKPQTGAEADRTLVKNGDVLVCITGGRTGAVGFIRRIGERAYINQHICLLRADRRVILPELLGHMLWSEIGQKQIELSQYGVKQGLGFNEVAKIRIPVPPIDEQPQILEQINQSTTQIDAVIARIADSLERLRELRAALITAAVTGQIDPATWGRRGDTDRRLEAIERGMEMDAEPAGATT